MARTKINDKQLEKLVNEDKVSGAALNITGSDVSALTTLTGGDHFLVQSGSAVPKKITADTMSEFFSKVDLTEAASQDAAMRIVFVDESGLENEDLFVDSSVLTYNPTSTTLTVPHISVGDDLLMASDGAVLSMGSSADVTFTHDGSAGLGIAAGGAFDIDAAGALTLDGASITIGGDSDVAVDFDSSTFDLDASGAITIDGTSTLSLDAADDSNFSMAANSSSTKTLTIAASNSGSGAGAIDVDADGAITVDSSGAGVSIDGAAASNFSTSAGDLTLEAGGSSNKVVVKGDSTSGVAIHLDANEGSSSEIHAEAGVIDLDASAAVEIDAGSGISLDAGAASNFSASSGDLTIEAGGSSNKLVLKGDHASGVAIHLDANEGSSSEIHMEAGVLDMDATGAATLDAGGAIGITGAGVDINAGSGTLELTSSGAVDVNGAAITVDGTSVSLDASDDSNFSVAGNSSSAVTLTLAASNSGSGAGNMALSADTVTITGNLDVNGTTTTIDTVSVAISDHNIVIDRDNSTSAVIDGAGITMEGGSGDDITIQQLASGDRIEIKKGSGYHGLAVGKLMVDSADDHIDTSGGNLVITAGTSGADIVLDPAGANVLPGGDSEDSLGADGTAWAKLFVDDIDLNGQGRIDLDADADTSIRASADDVITYEVAGVDEFQMSANMFGPSTADGAALGGASNEWSDLFLADSAAISLGADQDVSLTHVPDTGLLLNSSMQLQFGDSATAINQSTDGQLDIDADVELELTAPIVDINASNAVRISNDLELDSDSAAIKMGADNTDITLTHSRHDGDVTLGSDFKDTQPTASFSSFDATKISNSSLSSSTSTITLSSALGISIDGGTTVRLQHSGGNLDFTVPGSVSSSATSFSVSSVTGTLSNPASNTISVSKVLTAHKNAFNQPSFSGSTTSLAFTNADQASAFASAAGGGGATIRISDGSNSIDLALQSYSSGTSINVSSATMVAGSSVSVSGMQSAGSIKQKSVGADSHRLTLDGAQASLVIADHDGSSHGLYLGSTLVSATGTELNIMDGDTSAASVTLVAADGVVINDGGTMKQALVSDFGTFLAGEGLDASSGVLKVTPITDIATSASKGSILSENSAGLLVSASLSQDMVSGSLQVFLNGMLQTPSGSVQGTPDGETPGGGTFPNALFDYTLVTTGTTNGHPAAVFADELDGDDVVQLVYLKK